MFIYFADRLLTPFQGVKCYLCIVATQVNV